MAQHIASPRRGKSTQDPHLERPIAQRARRIGPGKFVEQPRGFGQMTRRAGYRSAIGRESPCNRGQHLMPDEVALEIDVLVALVFHPLQAMLACMLEDFL